jgi:predicted transcriptional regulator
LNSLRRIPPSAHAAFRLSKDLLATIDIICGEFDLTRSQLFRRSVAEYIRKRGYDRDLGVDQ